MHITRSGIFKLLSKGADLEVDIEYGPYRRGGEGQSKRANIVPSAEGGKFYFSDPRFGEHVVGKIGLAGISKEQVEDLVVGSLIQRPYSPRETDFLHPKRVYFQ